MLADIGGTHIRLGISRPAGQIESIVKWPVGDFENLCDALAHYREQNSDLQLQDIAIATAAWPIGKGKWGFARDDRWIISASELKDQGWDLRYIGNDFGASAIGIVAGAHDDYTVIRKGDNAENKVSLVIGPGTGLGIAYVDQQGDRPIVRETFGGHMSCPAETFDQMTILRLAESMKEESHSLVAEHLVSGPGFILIFKAVCRMKGFVIPDDLSMQTIAVYRDHPAFDQAVEYFCQFLGLTVHQAVMFGHAFAGVYLDGGVIHYFVENDIFDSKTFLKSFTREPVESVRRAVSQTPIYVVNDPFIALKGLQQIIA